jgi:uncharacterized protein (UPF0261 family)
MTAPLATLAPLAPLTTLPGILLVGTADTKSDELAFMARHLRAQGMQPLVMDVGVLHAGAIATDIATDISNHAVASAAGTSLAALIESGDENTAMTAMAQGAALLATQLYAQGRIQGLLALGGTMGTDLAFDVAAALPLGVPKVIVSTVAYSHLIPPERITPDLIMVLWAGGLYGLNSLCESALAQGVGAVAGAVRAARPPRHGKPMVGMTSLGKSCLAYMVALKPALEQRGFELAVFHTTGMGGRAFEALAGAGHFAAVMDFSLQELANHLGGSCVTSGADRLTGAGRSGTPQIVAPGAVDMVDFPAWQPVPAALADRPVHVHNRLIASATSAPDLRRSIAQTIADRLAQATGSTHLLLPLRGVEAWDLPGQPLHDPIGQDAFNQALRQACAGRVTLTALDAHINDATFAEAALRVFDDWLASGAITNPLDIAKK